ncbi:hypothetical protein FACS189437_06900 [Bacteroidia bacterium]|nr:hypothetical protein FACS189437_06900 [Bacteroidia bacterium]
MPTKEKKDTVYMLAPTQPDMLNDNGDVIIPSNKKLKPVKHANNLPAPPKINFTAPTSIHTRSEYIENNNITGDMKNLIVACDYDNPTVRNNSAALVALSPGEFNLGQVCDIFDFSYTNWSYVNDPVTRDYYAKASETLKNGLNGDCDDFAILLCAMILSIGGEARISFAYDDTEGHAFTEVNIGTTNRHKVENYLTARYGNNEMWHREDANGNWWLNLDWQGQCPGAKYFKFNRGICFNIIRNIYENL